MKRPSFQFYPADWLTDAALRMVSIGARGLWIDMLCIMHQGTQYGYLKVNDKVILNANLARMTGSTLHEVEGWLLELSDAGVYSTDDSNCIYSRRMIRDEEIRQARADGGYKGGNPNLMGKNKVNLNANLKPTPSSTSSTSSTSTINSKATQKKSKEKLDYNDYPEFLEFWSSYPNKDGKYKALESWVANKPPIDKILNSLSWQKQTKKWTDDNGQYVPMATTYINGNRWDDEPSDTSSETMPF